MGRSRGGLTSKIHVFVDAEGRPVNLHLTGGQIADCTEADALTDGLGEEDILLADKGYDSNAIRAKAAERKAWANIPPKTNRKESFVFSRWVYRQRKMGKPGDRIGLILPRDQLHIFAEDGRAL